MSNKLMDQVRDNIDKVWPKFATRHTNDQWVNCGDIDWLEHGGVFVKWEVGYHWFEVLQVRFYELDDNHFFEVATTEVGIDKLIEPVENWEEQGYEGPELRYKDDIESLVSFCGAQRQELVLGTLFSDDPDIASEGIGALLWVVSSIIPYQGACWEVSYHFTNTDKYSDEWEKQWEINGAKVEQYLYNQGLKRDWEFFEPSVDESDNVSN